MPNSPTRPGQLLPGTGGLRRRERGQSSCLEALTISWPEKYCWSSREKLLSGSETRGRAHKEYVRDYLYFVRNEVDRLVRYPLESRFRVSKSAQNLIFDLWKTHCTLRCFFSFPSRCLISGLVAEWAAGAEYYFEHPGSIPTSSNIFCFDFFYDTISDTWEQAPDGWKSRFCQKWSIASLCVVDHPSRVFCWNIDFLPGYGSTKFSGSKCEKLSRGEQNSFSGVKSSVDLEKRVFDMGHCERKGRKLIFLTFFHRCERNFN